MTDRRLTLLVALALAVGGCGPSDLESVPAWTGTVTTAGSVTTVVNEAGSIWGGERVLAEELSIGVAEGDDAFMLGRVAALALTDDRIYVVDAQVPAVRVYDLAGRHLRDVGRAGEGPGEFVLPSMLAASPDGRVFVYDMALRRIVAFAPDGATLREWAISDGRCCQWPMYATGGGAIWVPVSELSRGPSPGVGGARTSGRPAGPVRIRFGARFIREETLDAEPMWVPDLEYEASTVPIRGGQMPGPFTAWLVWSPTPAGGLVAGGSDRYRFEVHRPDGGTLVVERDWNPTEIPAEHREWERRKTIAFHREYNDPEWAWDGDGMPVTKPAFVRFYPAESGEIWLLRQGASTPRADCVEDPVAEGIAEAEARPCWRDEGILDVFGADGRFLGAVSLPVDWSWGAPFVPDGDRVLTLVEDDLGTLRVKLYRVRMPESAPVP